MNLGHTSNLDLSRKDEVRLSTFDHQWDIWNYVRTNEATSGAMSSVVPHTGAWIEMVKKIEQDVLFYFLLAPIQMLSSSTRVLKRRIPCLVPCTMAVAKSLLVQSRGTKIPSSTMFIRKRSRSCFIQ